MSQDPAQSHWHYKYKPVCCTWVHACCLQVISLHTSALVLSAMPGPAVLLAPRESRQLSRAAAGLLQSDTPRRQRLGMKKSSLVLLGRLMMAALLMFAGYRQVRGLQGLQLALQPSSCFVQEQLCTRPYLKPA